MKRSFLVLVLALCTILSLVVACGTRANNGTSENGRTQRYVPKVMPKVHPEALLANNKIDSIFLRRSPLDPNMDISKYNLYELLAIKHSIKARYGQWFQEQTFLAPLRATDWYENLVLDKVYKLYEADPLSEDVHDIVLAEAKLSLADQTFIQRIEKRISELRLQNYQSVKDYRVNIKNVINPFLLEDFSTDLQHLLSANGFAIVPSQYDQLFEVYESNQYMTMPHFITTDLYLQLFHMYFDCMLRELEKDKLIPMLTKFSKDMHQKMQQKRAHVKANNMKEAIDYDLAFWAIGHKLLTEEKWLEVPNKYKNITQEEVRNVLDARPKPSRFLPNGDYYFMYDLYTPRGHYTRNAQFKRYFRGMMWFQNAPSCLEDLSCLRQAIVPAVILNESPGLRKQYEAITSPIHFIVGEPDNLSTLQLADMIKQKGYTFDQLMTDDQVLRSLQTEMKKLADAQNKISPIGDNAKTCREKINIMPQRYLPDNEVLLHMVDYDSQKSLRPYPSGLDVLASFGWKQAEDLLMGELGEENLVWQDFGNKLNAQKLKMSQVNWEVSMYNKWIKSLLELQKKEKNAPYFMVTPEWGKKDLNAALASWSELKHDVILYAEQPIGAECGAGSELPEPYFRSYVEPNVAYWQEAIALIDLTTSLLKKHNLLTKRMGSISTSVREIAELFLNVSQKELNNEPIPIELYSNLESIGGSIEYLTLDLISTGTDDSPTGWGFVSGTDKSVAVVADVYTANASNNRDKKGILYEATGDVDEIYVIVEMDGFLYLTRGAVLSYREFKEPIDNPRHTDESWQQLLKMQPNHGIPSWMREIILNGKIVVPDETIFYSSGC